MTIAAAVVAVWFGILTRDVQAGTWGTSGVFPNLMFLAALLAFAVVGLVVATRQPGNAIGWILLQIGLVAVVSGSVDGYAAYAIYVRPGLPAGPLVLSMSQWLWVPSFGMAMTFLLLLFPDGHLPSPRWRWFAWVTAIDLALISLGILLSPGEIDGSPGVHNVFGVQGAQFLLLAFVWFPIAIIASAASLIIRLRRTRGAERAQIKWLVTAATIVASFYAFILVLSLLANGSARWILFLQNVTIVMFGLIPIAIGFSVLRYRLFDIDLVIRKAVLIALLAGFVTLGYVAVVVAVGLVFDVRTLDAPTSAFAAACVAFGFAPVRRWARRISDRAVYGKRATPYEVLTEFGDQLAGSYAADDVLVRMARVLAEGLGAERARVWLGPPEARRVAATWPVDAPERANDDHTEAVLHQGEELGAFSVAMPANDPMDPAKQKLVADLAGQAGLALRNVGLTEALRQRLQDLRAAQKRLVAAQDHERRRLERNIHDGAQQQLVALQVRQRLAEQLIERDPAGAKRLLADLQVDTASALDDLRDLARGIYPPLLADKGLAAALIAQARKSPVPATVEADGVERLSEDVEAAAYFSCLEALQNVAKYAGATAVSIRLWQNDGRLGFAVADDGTGFDPASTGYGTGLQGIADRLGALDGTLSVVSAPGGGTKICGSLPVGPVDARVLSGASSPDTSAPSSTRSITTAAGGNG
ncbi:MAG: histidine kinase [Actinomycetota bacterium]